MTDPRSSMRIGKTRFMRVLSAACTAFAIALAAAWVVAIPAYADDAQPDESQCCTLSEQDREAYEKDGSLAERTEFMESLENDEVNEGLVELAAAREKRVSTRSAKSAKSNIPNAEKLGLSTTGKVRALALRVDFPAENGAKAKTFGKHDTLDALQSLFDGKGNEKSFPYDSLSAYYRRSSYGALDYGVKTYNYTAKHARGYYTDRIETLYEEALKSLDGKIDYKQFDGNGDGTIDCVYLHFAGGDEGWGSPWWSYEEEASLSKVKGTYDGLKAGTIIMLHEPSATADGPSQGALRTAIHETGHALGLPDYYHYDSYGDGSSGTCRTGILASDMMNDNLGEHNGFSKWLLGWIPDSKITRITANDGGIAVTRGGKTVEKLSAADSASVDLASFVASETECGGIAVVANENKGVFSSYYLAEYDTHANNLSVSCANDGETWNMPSGFRLWRVQAELSADKTGLKKSNTYGRVFDQLLELVDVDMTWKNGEYRPHFNSDDSIIAGEGNRRGEFECMLRNGGKITPDTFPSTNFNESKASGATGLSIEAKNCGDAAGTLVVSYRKPTPVNKSDFTVTAQKGERLIPECTLSFSIPMEAKLADKNIAAVLSVDGKKHKAFAESVSISTNKGKTSTRLYIRCPLDPQRIDSESKCTVTFPAGLFVLGKSTASPEITLKVTPSSSLASVDGGTIETNDVQWSALFGGQDKPCLSEPVTGDDGNTRFVLFNDLDSADDGEAVLYSAKGDSIRNPKAKALWFYENGKKRHVRLGVDDSNKITARLFDAGNGKLFAIYTWTEESEARQGTYGFWIDRKTGQVTGMKRSGSLSQPLYVFAKGQSEPLLDEMKMATDGNDLVALLGDSSQQIFFMQRIALSSATSNKAPTVQRIFVDTDYKTNYTVSTPSRTTLAIARETWKFTGSSSRETIGLDVYDAGKLSKLLKSKGSSCKANKSISQDEGNLSQLGKGTVLHLKQNPENDSVSILDVAANDKSCYVLTTEDADGKTSFSTTEYSLSGKKVGKFTTDMENRNHGAYYRRLTLADGGSIAMTAFANESSECVPSELLDTTVTLLLSPSLKMKGMIQQHSDTVGTWANNGAWVGYGWQAPRASRISAGQGASPVADSTVQQAVPSVEYESESIVAYVHSSYRDDASKQTAGKQSAGRKKTEKKAPSGQASQSGKKGAAGSSSRPASSNANGSGTATGDANADTLAASGIALSACIASAALLARRASRRKKMR